MSNKFVVAVAALLLTSNLLAATPAQKMYQATVNSIISDLQDDIRREASRGHFETSVLLDVISYDTLNQVVNKFVKDGYKVCFETVMHDDREIGIRIEVYWDTEN